MPTGFTTSTKTAEAYIKNHFKYSKKARVGCSSIEEYVEANRFHNSNAFRDKQYEFSIADLLQPEKEELCLIEPEEFSNKDVCGDSQIHILQGENSIWRMSITYAPQNKFKIYDFNIMVNQGGTHRFSADDIESVITRKYGSIIYQQWKHMVKDEIPALKELVQAFRDSINTPITSVTQSIRSEKLCRSVGIPVRQGLAFLFPSSYKI